mmetsp:Transcript_1338/g.1586  ORF Transcript_1338/g.1586 Transcript_1338/m.1586 type:complete len:358 (+) Transcript_1338:79-1152(+)|eukprot:CAMPEP_0204645006 /NCGR_PEP_ID=MMETSP0718-20130828/1881_1 /ASSEMBLY_ACC=CAM_ASM_000674 /TAXON_ID=230516 /ORGANISM="Chaetoceros curvisetus" /LENGTH=357 /DNA_ID=CAMNT_0051666733 /DNA_START=56 /DNA_END=1129 /DNA_ORIENTATION=+
MEPASSSDDDSSVEKISSRKISPMNENDESSSDYDSDSSAEEEETELKHEFDDLPSEDSCLDEDSDDSDDDESEEEEEENLSLAERVHARKYNGVERKGETRAGKKSKARALAQQRLSEMKRKRNQKFSGKSESDDEDGNDSDASSIEEAPTKKKSKYLPTVASSSRKAYFQRGAPELNSSGIGVEIGANKYKARDPRMQSLSGYYDENVFQKRYAFLEDMQDEEIDTLKKKCKAWKMTGRKGQKMRKKLGLTGGDSTAEEDQEELKRLIQERASRKASKIAREAKSAVKKRLREDVAAGKRGAYYLKKRDMKKLELEARFDQLRKSGGDGAVNKVLAKRRKKKMGKDSGLMPSTSG